MKKQFGFFLLITIAVVFAQEKSAGTENRVKIGILNLERFDKADDIADNIQATLVSLLKEVGFYECFEQNALEEHLKKTGDTFPKRCRDPKCVLQVGRLTGMDRMLFGTVEWGNSQCGIKLVLIDVRTQQTIEKATIKGGEGIGYEAVLKAAVAKIHGRNISETDFSEYFGPRVHNENQMYVSSALCLGIGILYSGINYGVEQNVERLSAAYDDEPLSGIATTGVPLFARPAALANAYVALSDDAYGVLYNPAGMSWVSGPQAVLAYQYRFGLNNVAASYVNKATREIGFGQALLYRADNEQLMTEMFFVTAISYKFNTIPNVRPFSLGVNIKIASNRVKSTSDISSGGSSMGVGFDAGLMWELSEKIRYGLLLRDIPLIHRWKNVITDKRYNESQPISLHMGGTFKVGYTTLLIAEGQIPLYDDQPWKMAGGLEQELFNLFCIRLGIKREIMSLYETPWHLTGGFGFKVTTNQETGRYLSLDGSYEYNTLQVFDVINVSMRVGF